MAKSKKNKKLNIEADIKIEDVASELFPDGSDINSDISIESAIFLQEDTELEGIIPEVLEDESELEEDILSSDESVNMSLDLEGSELEAFESAQIDEIEFIEDELAESIIESILFASDRPVSIASIREVFKGTNIKKDKIRRILDNLSVEYAGGRRGITLDEITGGYQLRTKVDNMNFLKRTVKSRPFKLSGPALETLAIVAYKQPVVKNEIDQIRGVESGHLLRALMEKGLCCFEGKAENLPGKPMQYGTTRRFLEIFGLRNLKELPTLSQIDELLPQGIGDEEEEKPTLSMVTDSMSEEVKSVSYSEGEEELGKIENELSSITTSSDFFEQEKIRQKQKKEAEKAQDIRDALAVGEEVSNRDKNWLAKYEQSLLAPSETAIDEALQAEAAAENLVEVEQSDDNSSDESDEQSDELPFYEEADHDVNELSDESMSEPEQNA
jgi:segregation and condensation protein B